MMTARKPLKTPASRVKIPASTENEGVHFSLEARKKFVCSVVGTQVRTKQEGKESDDMTKISL